MLPARPGKPLAELFSNPSFPKITRTFCTKTPLLVVSLFFKLQGLGKSRRVLAFLILCMKLGRLSGSSAIYCKLSIITIFKVTSLEVNKKNLNFKIKGIRNGKLDVPLFFQNQVRNLVYRSVHEKTPLPSLLSLFLSFTLSSVFLSLQCSVTL